MVQHRGGCQLLIKLHNQLLVLQQYNLMGLSTFTVQEEEFEVNLRLC
jgi:hypothetical protein